MASPLATPLAWELVADDYAEVTAPFFENYAKIALDRAGVMSSTRVLDVAAGPGTLALLAARRGCQVTAVDFAPAMLERLRTRAQAGERVETLVADGQALPFPDNHFDAAFSLFGLIFFPERDRGFRELYRVLAPGGCGIITSWQPMERFPMLGDIYAALRHLLPEIPFGDGKAPLGELAQIVDEMTAAGFGSVTVEEISATAEAPSLDQAWNFLCRGSAPFCLLRRNIGEAAWAEVEKGILVALRERYGSGPQKMTMVANLGAGRKA